MITDNIDISPFCADNTGGYSRSKPERISNSQGPLTNFNFIRISDKSKWQIFFIYSQKREISIFIMSD